MRSLWKLLASWFVLLCRGTPLCHSAFRHSALLEWPAPERLSSLMKVRVCLHGGYSLCRDEPTFMLIDSCETQASRIYIFMVQGLRKPYNYCLQDCLENILLFFFFLVCALLALSLIQPAPCAGIRVILTSSFMSGVWSHPWKLLCGS